MKNLYIILISILFICSCQKDQNLENKIFNNSNSQIQLTEKNQQFVEDFLSNTSQRSDLIIPTLNEGMLNFESVEDLYSYYDALKEERQAFTLSNDELAAFDNVTHPFDKSVNEELGFVSLRDHYDVNTDYSSEGLEEEIEDYIATPILQTLLSDKKEIAIGGKIVKYMPMDKTVAIEGLNSEGLEDTRINGLGAIHPSLTFYSRQTGKAVSNLGPNGPGPDGPGPNENTCKAYYRKDFTTGIGDDANKVRFFSRVYSHGCQYNNSIQYKVEWGDGTTSTYSGGYINHTYPTPNFSIGECHTYNVKLTITFVDNCLPCLKGKQWVNNFSITLCPIDLSLIHI